MVASMGLLLPNQIAAESRQANYFCLVFGSFLSLSGAGDFISSGKYWASIGGAARPVFIQFYCRISYWLCGSNWR